MPPFPSDPMGSLVLSRQWGVRPAVGTLRPGFGRQAAAPPPPAGVGGGFSCVKGEARRGTRKGATLPGWHLPAHPDYGTEAASNGLFCDLPMSRMKADARVCRFWVW